jgi:A/G-specific adenine glycosylase
MTNSDRALRHLKFGDSVEIGGSLVDHCSFSKPAFVRKLLRWFDRHQRDLPWRRDRDPYRIWVSEVMLQQTTVAAVIPYFERFLETFPTLAELAAADEQSVLRLWSGLGYYRRARNLHRAAQMLHAEHGGSLPDDPDLWASLPGVGRYILGAVLSQAFDRRLPIVEANSQRVLCRLFGQDGDASREPVKSWLWNTATQLLPRRRAGDFNQALMELGAIVCTPESPRCGECPVTGSCAAKALGRQHEIPQKAQRKTPIDVLTVAVAIRKGGRVLLAQRSDDAARWAGMWELPHTERHGGESVDAAAQRLLKSVGVRADLERELLTIKHGVTHHRITLTGVEAAWRRGEFSSSVHARVKWLRPAELGNYPTGSAQGQLLDAVRQPRRNLF